MKSNSSPITQVSQASPATQDQVQVLPSRLHLRLRGVQTVVEREVFVCLPESLLLAMFPHGLSVDRGEDGKSADDDIEVISEFDPACLAFVLHFFRKARARFENERGEFAEEFYLANAASQAATGSPVHPGHFLLLTRQAILVLREELDYFVVPQEPARMNKEEQLHRLKCSSGDHLHKQDLVLQALLQSIDRASNMAEHRLVEILCDAGFSKHDRWAYRTLEPQRTSISSMAMVSLNTRESDPSNQLVTAQKLLLFWRKPARKCWWDRSCTVLAGSRVKLWARRTWTLELALI